MRHLSHSRRLFRSTGKAGFSNDVVTLPGVTRARKQVRELKVDFARRLVKVRTPEGAVRAALGDAILTGSMGERWCMPAERFALKYIAVSPTVAGRPGLYASIPVEIMAVPMQEAFEVILEDRVSRLQGQPGDWLVDYGDGSLGVIAQRIFAASYDVLPPAADGGTPEAEGAGFGTGSTGTTGSV